MEGEEEGQWGIKMFFGFGGCDKVGLGDVEDELERKN